MRSLLVHKGIITLLFHYKEVTKFPQEMLDKIEENVESREDATLQVKTYKWDIHAEGHNKLNRRTTTVKLTPKAPGPKLSLTVSQPEQPLKRKIP